MNGIQVKNCTKNYGDVRALNDVSLLFEPGKIYGLLGRNGAGKTTLLNLITNRIFADSGEVMVDGRSNKADNALRNLYMMSEKNYYPENMKIRDVFRWSKEFYPAFDMDYANSLADQFGLKTDKRIKALSTGYASIAKIIVALSVNADYVLLDEPVLGLDANHREMFYRLLLENYSERPKTFVISTHLIEEAANVIEDIVIIKNGQILRSQPCEQLLYEAYTVSGLATAVDEYGKNKHVFSEDIVGGLKSAYIMGTPDAEEARHKGLELSKPDLQKLFIRLTNE